MMECWNTGYEKRKKIYSTKNVGSNFYDDSRQTSIFCFCPKNKPMLREYQSNFMGFDSFFFRPIIPLLSPSRRLYEQEARTHDSTIPAFQHSNWGEAPNLDAIACIGVESSLQLPRGDRCPRLRFQRILPAGPHRRFRLACRFW